MSDDAAGDVGWAVSVEVTGPPATDDDFESKVVELLELFAPYAGSVIHSRNRDRYGATFSLDEPASVFDAVADGVRLFRELAAQAGLPAWAVVRVEAMTFVEQEPELRRDL